MTKDRKFCIECQERSAREYRAARDAVKDGRLKMAEFYQRCARHTYERMWYELELLEKPVIPEYNITQPEIP
jgi:hypothetical protein